MILSNVTVLIADGLPDAKEMSHTINQVVLPQSKVEISDNFDKSRQSLGYADLWIEGNEVKANLELNIELHPEVANRYFPCVGGKLLKTGGFSIDGIGIATENVDSRIKSLGGQCGTGVKEHSAV